MKILFLTKFFYPHIGGAEKHVLMISRELVKRNHQVTIATQKYDPKLKSFELIQGIKVVRLPYCESKWGIWRKLWQNRQLLNQLTLFTATTSFLVFAFLPAFTI